MEKNNTSSERQNVSFKFTKRVAKTLSGNKLEDPVPKNVEKDFVISVINRDIKSTAPKEPKKEFVIPLIKENNWRFPDEHNKKQEDSDSLINQMAVEELLKESKERNEEWTGKNDSNMMSIPLMMQNKIPDGYETDERMDVSLRPDVSTLDEYEKVPVEKFGLALLHGMGWKEGDSIGINAKAVSEPIQVQRRPKGLGLGADTAALNKLKEKNRKDDNELQLVKGAYVRIMKGANEGFYGQVQGLDEESARVIIKISGNDKAVSYPEFSVQVVSKKEFEKESKVINREAYEKYRREHLENGKSEDKSRERTRREKESPNEGKRSSKDDRKRSHESRNTAEQDSDRRKRKSERSRSSDRKSVCFERIRIVPAISTLLHEIAASSSDSQRSNSHKSSKTWVRPQLRVRIIDDEYKKGRYFNEKVVVVDVLSSKSCTCKTDNNKYLEDVSPSMLETVIPRAEQSYVMIVNGKYSGELCTILEKDKSRCLATVQFLSDRDHAIQVEYDSICEYVGDVAEFD